MQGNSNLDLTAFVQFCSFLRHAYRRVAKFLRLLARPKTRSMLQKELVRETYVYWKESNTLQFFSYAPLVERLDVFCEESLELGPLDNKVARTV